MGIHIPYREVWQWSSTDSSRSEVRDILITGFRTAHLTGFACWSTHEATCQSSDEIPNNKMTERIKYLSWQNNVFGSLLSSTCHPSKGSSIEVQKEKKKVLFYLELAHFHPVTFNFLGSSWHFLQGPHHSGLQTQPWDSDLRRFTALTDFSRAAPVNTIWGPGIALGTRKRLRFALNQHFPAIYSLCLENIHPWSFRFTTSQDWEFLWQFLLEFGSAPLSLIPLTEQRSCNYSRY